MKTIDEMTEKDKKERKLFFTQGKGWVTGRYRNEFLLEDGKKINGCFIDDYLFVIKPLYFVDLPENPP